MNSIIPPIDVGKSHRNLLWGTSIFLMETLLVLLIKSKFASPGRVIHVLSHTIFLIGYLSLDSPIDMEQIVTLSLALEVIADVIILLPKVFSEQRAIFRGFLHFVIVFNASLFIKWTTLDEWRKQATLYVMFGNLLPNWLIIYNNRGTVRKEFRNKSRKIQIIWFITFRMILANAYYFKSIMSNRSWDMIDVNLILEWIYIADMIFGPFFSFGKKGSEKSEREEIKLG